MSFGRRPRRQVEWAGLEFGPTNVAASPVLVASLDETLVQLLVPATLVRVRGILHVASDQQVAFEQFFGVLAGIVVQGTAETAGIGSIPTPLTEIGEDNYFLYQPFAGSEERHASGEPGRSGWQYMIDSRAQRKLESGDALAFPCEVSSNGSGVTVMGILRMLFKVH